MTAQRTNDPSGAPTVPRRPDASKTTAAWTIEGLVARQIADASSSAKDPGPPVRIQLDRPASGITVGDAANAGWPIHLLGLALAPATDRAAVPQASPIAPADRWVRGDDVVAVYEPADPRSLRATAMWRRWPTGSPGVAAWELVVSCQTSLLESDATVAVHTSVPARRIAVPAAPPSDWQWRSLAGESPAGDGVSGEGLSATAVLVRTAPGPSVLVAVHPLDARRLTVGPLSDGVANGAERVGIDCWLFPSLVEKGVLLRGRTLAAIGPHDGDTEWAARLLDAFNGSPPPLTT